MTYNKLTAMLIRHEGFRATPYTDTTGNITIGYGRLVANITDDEYKHLACGCMLTDIGITEKEATYLMKNDITRATVGLAKTFAWFEQLDEVRQCALIDMVFNLGLAGFRRFAITIRYLAEGNYPRAAKEILRSIWAKQVGDRANEISEMLRTGKWSDK